LNSFILIEQVPISACKDGQEFPDKPKSFFRIVNPKIEFVQEKLLV